MAGRPPLAKPGRLVTAPPLTWDQYAARWARLHGGIDPRRTRPSVRRWLRVSYSIAKLAARAKLKPGAVTTVGLIVSALVPVFAIRGPGPALLAALLVVVAAGTDAVAGALAVLTSRATRLGYVYGAVADRMGEFFWLLALWRLGAPASATIAAGGLTWLHEYTRSRANAAGSTEIGAATLGERPTRVFVSVFGLGLAGLIGLGSRDLSRGIVTFAVVTWLVLAIIGFAQLFASVHRSLAGREWPMWKAPPMAQIVPVSAPPVAPAPPYHDVDPEPYDAELSEIAASMSPSTTIYASESVMHTSPIGLTAVGFNGVIALDDSPAGARDLAVPLAGRHSAPPSADEPADATRPPEADQLEADQLEADQLEAT